MLYFNNWCTLTYHTRQIDINVHLSRDDIIRTTNTKLELLKKNGFDDDVIETALKICEKIKKEKIYGKKIKKTKKI